MVPITRARERTGTMRPANQPPGPADPAGTLLTVGEVAELARVSVRTLHHYHEIGLLEPTARTEAGYRLYGRGDLERLHQALLFRELGFTLDAIRSLLDEPDADRRAALRSRRGELEAERRRTDAVIRAVDRALEALEEGVTMTDAQLFEGFDEFDHARYAEEAEERWGSTAAYRQAKRRTDGYGKADWAAIREEGEAIVERLAALMRAGADPADEEAMAVAEEHRRHIDARYYDCPPRMHAGLADMYEADARFGDYFERRAEGLTAFASAAIRANAARGPHDG